MQDISKESLEPSITVHYNGKIYASMQGYIKGSVVPFITIHYNG
jgi:hypothetical protein